MTKRILPGSGIPYTGGFTTLDENSIYPLFDPAYALGGLRNVNTLSDLTNSVVFSHEKLQLGTMAYVETLKSFYVLNNLRQSIVIQLPGTFVNATGSYTFTEVNDAGTTLVTESANVIAGTTNANGLAAGLRTVFADTFGIQSANVTVDLTANTVTAVFNSTDVTSTGTGRGGRIRWSATAPTGLTANTIEGNGTLRSNIFGEAFEALALATTDWNVFTGGGGATGVPSFPDPSADGLYGVRVASGSNSWESFTIPSIPSGIVTNVANTPSPQSSIPGVDIQAGKNAAGDTILINRIGPSQNANLTVEIIGGFDPGFIQIDDHFPTIPTTSGIYVFNRNVDPLPNDEAWIELRLSNNRDVTGTDVGTPTNLQPLVYHTASPAGWRPGVIPIQEISTSMAGTVTTFGNRPEVRFNRGQGTQITVADNIANDRIDVTIDTHLTNVRTVASGNQVDIIVNVNPGGGASYQLRRIGTDASSATVTIPDLLGPNEQAITVSSGLHALPTRPTSGTVPYIYSLGTTSFANDTWEPAILRALSNVNISSASQHQVLSVDTVDSSGNPTSWINSTASHPVNATSSGTGAAVAVYTVTFVDAGTLATGARNVVVNITNGGGTLTETLSINPLTADVTAYATSFVSIFNAGSVLSAAYTASSSVGVVTLTATAVGSAFNISAFTEDDTQVTNTLAQVTAGANADVALVLAVNADGNYPIRRLVSNNNSTLTITESGNEIIFAASGTGGGGGGSGTVSSVTAGGNTAFSPPSISFTAGAGTSIVMPGSTGATAAVTINTLLENIGQTTGNTNILVSNTVADGAPLQIRNLITTGSSAHLSIINDSININSGLPSVTSGNDTDGNAIAVGRSYILRTDSASLNTQPLWQHATIENLNFERTTAAAVTGQSLVIKAIDGSGNPTSWENRTISSGTGEVTCTDTGGGVGQNDIDWNTTPVSNNNGFVQASTNNSGFTWIINKTNVTITLACGSYNLGSFPPVGQAGLEGDTALTALTMVSSDSSDPDGVTRNIFSDATGTYNSTTGLLTVDFDTSVTGVDPIRYSLFNSDLTQTWTLNGTFSIGSATGFTLSTNIHYQQPIFFNTLRTINNANIDFNSSIASIQVTRTNSATPTSLLITNFGSRTATGSNTGLALGDGPITFDLPTALTIGDFDGTTQAAMDLRSLFERVRYTNATNTSQTLDFPVAAPQRVIAELSPTFFFPPYVGHLTLAEFNDITNNVAVFNGSRFTRLVGTSTPQNYPDTAKPTGFRDYTWPADSTMGANHAVIAFPVELIGADTQIRYRSGGQPSEPITKTTTINLGTLTNTASHRAYNVYLYQADQAGTFELEVEVL